MSTDEERVTALAALYQAERSDGIGIMNTSLALMGAGAAYLTATIALWDKFNFIKGWIVLLPLPLWCIAAFHSLLVASAVVKAKSVAWLEEELKPLAGFPRDNDSTASQEAKDKAKQIGASGTEQIMNMDKAIASRRNWPFGIATLVTYGGVGLIIVLYTILVIGTSHTYIGAWFIIPMIVYLALCTVVLLAWRAGLREVAKSADAIESPE